MGTEPINLAVLRGHLSRAPDVRQLPSGDELVAYEVTVREPGRPTASVPVVWIAPRTVAHLDRGDEVVVVGRVRRRFFRAAGATASRTEVVADRVVPARRRRSVDAALRSVAERLGWDGVP